jgi:hypothetical protein
MMMMMMMIVVRFILDIQMSHL